MTWWQDTETFQKHGPQLLANPFRGPLPRLKQCLGPTTETTPQLIVDREHPYLHNTRCRLVDAMFPSSFPAVLKF